MGNQETPRNIILIGFMGTGKTTVGRKIADSLGFEFEDTDERIISLAGKSIPAIFEEDGESKFRDIEAHALVSAARSQGKVISTGGGIVLRESNVDLIRHCGFVVWLKADPAEIHRRVSGNDDRPLLRTANPRKTIETMLAERECLYSEAAHCAVRTDNLCADEIAWGICENARVFFTAEVAAT